MAAVIECSAQDFEKVVFDSDILFLSFWADWCAPCKQFSSIYEEVALEHKDVIFMHLNVGFAAELCELLQIQSVPHLMVFKKGIAIYSEAGSMPKTVLEELVQQAKNVDVTKIKQET